MVKPSGFTGLIGAQDLTLLWQSKDVLANTRDRSFFYGTHHLKIAGDPPSAYQFLTYVKTILSVRNSELLWAHQSFTIQNNLLTNFFCHMPPL